MPVTGSSRFYSPNPGCCLCYCLWCRVFPLLLILNFGEASVELIWDVSFHDIPICIASSCPSAVSHVRAFTSSARKSVVCIAQGRVAESSSSLAAVMKHKKEMAEAKKNDLKAGSTSGKIVS